jgi:sulfite exporter TauE/SafE
MTDWPLIFVGGLLGSSHCVGMCGSFALSVGLGSNSLQGNFFRQMVYTLGRICTYAFGGAIAGFGGLWLSLRNSTLVNVQATLCVIAGVLLILQGLSSTGLISRLTRWKGNASPCPARSFFGEFLTRPGLTAAFVAGLLTGFLPCGLVYAFLALAASSGNLLKGSLAMILFGLGTAPLMIITGVGATTVSLANRRRVLQVAAWCVVATGLLSVNRGFGWIQIPGSDPHPKCPHCREASALTTRAIEQRL